MSDISDVDKTSKTSSKLTSGKLALYNLLKRTNYSFVYKQRSIGGTEHGGTAILYRNWLTVAPFTWNEAAQWNACDAVSLTIFPPKASPFIFTSFYLHATLETPTGPTPVEHHLRDLATVFTSFPEDMILAGDLNSQFTDIGGVSCPLHAQRGNKLEQVMNNKSIRLVAPSGATTFQRPTRLNGKISQSDESLFTGYNNDHFLVGCALDERLALSDLDCHPLKSPDEQQVNPDVVSAAPLSSWGSDHLPLYWRTTFADFEISKVEFKRITKFNKVSEVQKQQYNKIFRSRIIQALKSSNSPNYSMSRIEGALKRAEVVLPKTTPNIKTNNIYWKYARGGYNKTKEEAGNFNTHELIKHLEKARKNQIAEELMRNPNPSTIYENLDRHFSRAEPMVECPPLIDENGKSVVDQQHRVDTLARFYAGVGSDKNAGTELDATMLLKKEKRELDTMINNVENAVKNNTPLSNKERLKWKPLSFSELKASIAELNSGACLDFLGLKAEHLKLLDNDSIRMVLPFFDRQYRKGYYPTHWLKAMVSPVGKVKRPKQLLKSWRPVSVTAILSRLSEALVGNRLLTYWNRYRKEKSQFAYRKHVATTAAISTLTMFASDGFKQHVNYEMWDAEDPQQSHSVRNDHGMGARDRINAAQHQLLTLLVSIDASDAFCRALQWKIVRTIKKMDCIYEARWIANYLHSRVLQVREKGVLSVLLELAIGIPQGGKLSSLLWVIFIDPLVAQLEEECRKEEPNMDRRVDTQLSKIHGQISVPIVFADDINTAIKGFNVSSIILKANKLMAIVKKWSDENSIPMSKLKATWLVKSSKIINLIQAAVDEARREEAGAKREQQQQQQQQQQQEDTDDDVDNAQIRLDETTFKRFCKRKIVFDDQLSCYADTEPIRFLGVIFDSKFNFDPHIKTIITKCNNVLNYMEGLKRDIPAEKLKLLYESLVLSRMLFGADSYYPFISMANRKKLEMIHYRGCRIVTGLFKTSHALSTITEAGFPLFKNLVKVSVLKEANKLFHYQVPRFPRSTMVFGMDLFLHQIHFLQLPTAVIRPQRTFDGIPLPKRESEQEYYPKKNTETGYVDVKHDSEVAMTLRDITWNFDRSVPRKQLIYANSIPSTETYIMDKFVRIISSPPGNLKKPKDLTTASDEERKALREANRSRLAEIGKSLVHKHAAIYIFFDAARSEKNGGLCAGGYVVIRGCRFRIDNIIHRCQDVRAGPLACVYSGEINTLDNALDFVIQNVNFLFPGSGPREVVFIGDSQSTFKALEKTIIRKMNPTEMTVSSKLITTSRLRISIVMAFVFSHCGVLGNIYADRLANRALKTVGHLPPLKGYAHYDVLRPVLNRINEQMQQQLLQLLTKDEGFFRFNNIPTMNNNNINNIRNTNVPLIGLNLPRGQLSRIEEIRLFNARLGMMPEIGGFLHGQNEDCPFCAAKEVIARRGSTINHLFRRCTVISPILINILNNFLENSEQGEQQKKSLCALLQSADLVPVLWISPALSTLFLTTIIEKYQEKSKTKKNQTLQYKQTKSSCDGCGSVIAAAEVYTGLVHAPPLVLEKAQKAGSLTELVSGSDLVSCKSVVWLGGDP